ncbi:DNA-binding transcriptional regulator, MocR family, contains an aminotransferase domain [Cupriavidus sp. YR651]|uniref:aminotransferase-like domain-containing protein n=1 Tax=Cupriavidus sp. YR651 TaxID=1855315 RepID=UPI00089169ED|nr:PLP-dependent aminotransferase family protein [Cupriavidus sp. YR651]SDC66778.1 DNA-binding transcriptional regulator, MocR family, contains an aminotransferase domain [Cupriavidus sp. YR651]
MKRRQVPSSGTAGSLYEALADELTAAIRSGRLPAGSSLPSLRECAAQRKLSLNTVNAAYRLLEDRGLIAARPQSGFYVRSELAEPEFAFRRIAKDVMSPAQVDLMTSVLQAQQQPGHMDLAFAGPRGKRFYPGERLARITSSVLRRHGEIVATYALPPGSLLLREQIALRSSRLGMDLTADCIVLTHGAMEALQLALRAVTQAGDYVGIEAPSYFNIYPLLAALGLKAIEIPTHPQHGLDVDSVEHLLLQKRVAAVVAMPTVHNPLGCSMPVEAKQRLAQLLHQHRTPLIEDMVYAELQFREPLEPTIKSFDRMGWVLACGGFSKTLAPDYRIGWIVGGRYQEAVQRLKFASSASESMLLTEAVGQFLKSGGYEHHLRTLRRLYASQVATVRGWIAQAFPEGTRATQPTGGFVLWVELPPQVDSLKLFHAALARGIVIMPGQVYSKGPRYRHFLRLSCCQDIDDRFAAAIRTLGQLAAELLAGEVCEHGNH